MKKKMKKEIENQLGKKLKNKSLKNREKIEKK